jgi:hypothetical protein
MLAAEGGAAAAATGPDAPTRPDAAAIFNIVRRLIDMLGS